MGTLSRNKKMSSDVVQNPVVRAAQHAFPGWPAQ